MKYKDIRTREQLLERVFTRSDESLPILSVGNKMSRVNNLLSKTNDEKHKIKVKVIYTHTGLHSCIRFI